MQVMTVLNDLRDAHICLHTIYNLQDLKPIDYAKRVDFAIEMFLYENTVLLDIILFNDDSTFFLMEKLTRVIYVSGGPEDPYEFL